MDAHRNTILTINLLTLKPEVKSCSKNAAMETTMQLFTNNFFNKPS